MAEQDAYFSHKSARWIVIYMYIHMCIYMYIYVIVHMGWLRLVGSLKL